MTNGETYTPVPITDGKTAMRACLHMILKHTADMFEGLVDVVAEKYKLDKEEMMNVIIDHPRFKEMSVDPVMLDLGYILDPAGAAGAAEPPKKIRIMKIKPKTANATATAAALEPSAAPEQ